MTVSGYCDPRFAAIEPLFEDLWHGIEVGAAVSVYWRGEQVINLWGGHVDRAQSKEWNQDSLVNSYSITKGVMATAIAKLVETRKLDYREKVAHYWPEFAQNGKQDITVTELLSHQAGLCGIYSKLNVEDLYNWDLMTNKLAEQAPLWPPGSASGYHAVTWGYLSGELIRRVTNMSPGEFIHEQICKPLDLNFYLGVPEEKLNDCAELIGPNHARGYEPSAKPTKDSNKPAVTTTAHKQHLFDLAQRNPMISPFKNASSNPWRISEIPASNGHSDANSLAKLYGALANGGEINGIRLLSESTINNACQVEIDESVDLVMGHVIRRSRAGYILAHKNNYGPGTQSFGHAGAGGSMAFADPEQKVGFAYVMNQLQPEGYHHRYRGVLDEIYKNLD